VTRKISPIKIDQYKPLREVVFEALREAIIQGRLEPGERLMEIQLAEEMGVSRTPVREAIRKLELEGFVVMIPRKGAYVAGISLHDITDVFEVRAALESLAAGLAAERITEKELEDLERRLVEIAEVSNDSSDLNVVVERDTNFHDAIYKASRNKTLIQIVSRLQDQIQRFRSVSLAQPGRTKMAVHEHRQIVDAIANRDVELAQTLAREHIESAEQSMLVAFQKEKEAKKGEEK